MNEPPTTSPARRVVLFGIAVIVAVVAVGFLWFVALAPRPMDFAGGSGVALTQYHAEDPSGVPAELKGASLIERGEYLARAADCAVCHTAEGGVPYAGGRAFVLPFGTLSGVSPILPDATLTGVRSVNDPGGTNVAQIILSGAHRQTTGGQTVMPSFGVAYSDEEIASLPNYVTARFGAEPSALTAQKVAALRAQD